MVDADTVIVGAGSAGCLLAARLSEDAGRDVLLLEAGGDDRRKEIRIPAAFSKLFRSDVDWGYQTEPQEELAGRQVYWPRGKVVGGTSSMNAMIAIPGHAADYDSRHELGATGWDWASVAPALERVESALDLEELRDPNPLTRAFIAAAAEAGIPASPRLAPTALDGVRLTPVTQRRDRRHSAADAYLRPALGRPNLKLTTSAHATRIAFEGLRAVGIEYVRGETPSSFAPVRSSSRPARSIPRNSCSSPASAPAPSSPGTGSSSGTNCLASAPTSRTISRVESSSNPRRSTPSIPPSGRWNFSATCSCTGGS